MLDQQELHCAVADESRSLRHSDIPRPENRTNWFAVQPVVQSDEIVRQSG